MRSEWKEYTVQELIDLDMLDEPLDGNHGSIHPKASDYVDEGVPFIMANNLINGVVDLDGCVFISEEQAKTLRKGFAKPGDVLLTHKATIGRTAIVPDRYETIILTPQVTYYRVKRGIDNRYLKYYFDSPDFQTTLNNWAGSGSTRAYLGITAQHKLPVILPPYSEQQKIADILEVLDRKIQLNTEINKNLHDQAIAIFDKSYIAAAEQVPFTSVIQVLGGGTPKTGNPEFWGGEIPFFTPKDVGSPYVFNTEKTITEAGLDHCNSQLYDTNTTFVTARGTVGKVSLAGKPMAMNQSCYALASDSLDPILVYFYTLKAVESLKHKASGAVFDAIVTRDFNTEIISRIASNQEGLVLSTTRPMMQAILSNAIENLRLAQLRDALLLQLMSGELDVSDLDL